jgi:hypothetical protein
MPFAAVPVWVCHYFKCLYFSVNMFYRNSLACKAFAICFFLFTYKDYFYLTLLVLCCLHGSHVCLNTQGRHVFVCFHCVPIVLLNKLKSCSCPSPSSTSIILLFLPLIITWFFIVCRFFLPE